MRVHVRVRVRVRVRVCVRVRRRLRVCFLAGEGKDIILYLFDIFHEYYRCSDNCIFIWINSFHLPNAFRVYVHFNVRA